MTHHNLNENVKNIKQSMKISKENVTLQTNRRNIQTHTHTYTHTLTHTPLHTHTNTHTHTHTLNSEEYQGN